MSKEQHPGYLGLITVLIYRGKGIIGNKVSNLRGPTCKGDGKCIEALVKHIIK